MGITRLVVAPPPARSLDGLVLFGRAGVVAPKLRSSLIRDAEQLGHFAKRQAGADEVLYRLSLGAPSFGLGAPPGRFGLGEPVHGPEEQTRRGSTRCEALLRDRRLLGSQFTEPSCRRVIVAACSGSSVSPLAIVSSYRLAGFSMQKSRQKHQLISRLSYH